MAWEQGTMGSIRFQESTLPHGLVSSDDRALADQPEGLGTRVMYWLRQAFCGLHGHDSLLQFEKDRMFLKCVSCGHETPGWELTNGPQTVRLAPSEAQQLSLEMQQRSLAAQQLIRTQRIA
jgi:hypothetical protein